MNKWLKENVVAIAFVVSILMFVSVVSYTFKYHQKQNPSGIPPNYKLTSADPIITLGDKGEVFVRTDCTIEEYRNLIGGLAKDVLNLQKQVQALKAPPPIENKKQEEIPK